MYGFCDTLFRRSKPLKNSCGGSRLERRENPLEGLTIGRGTYLRSLAKDPPHCADCRKFTGQILERVRKVGVNKTVGTYFRIYSVRGDHNV